MTCCGWRESSEETEGRVIQKSTLLASQSLRKQREGTASSHSFFRTTEETYSLLVRNEDPVPLLQSRTVPSQSCSLWESQGRKFFCIGTWFRILTAVSVPRVHINRFTCVPETTVNQRGSLRKYGWPNESTEQAAWDIVSKSQLSLGINSTMFALSLSESWFSRNKRTIEGKIEGLQCYGIGAPPCKGRELILYPMPQ